MASFNKYNCFAADLGLKVHNLNVDTLGIILTATAPTATDTVFNTSVYPAPAAASGYPTGGVQQTGAYSQSAGLATLTLSPAVFTASGGQIGPFRYAVLYNASATGKNLIGWYDYGSSLTLNAGDTFTETWGSGVLTLQ